MDRLEDLRLFTLVAETRSFTRAAEKLSLSKSAASRRIAELEETLGARLFHRTTRSISLTQVGQSFRHACDHRGFVREGRMLRRRKEGRKFVISLAKPLERAEQKPRKARRPRKKRRAVE